MIKGLFVLGLAMSLVVAPDLRAQDADDAPGAVAVSYWKCSYANFGDTIALMNDVPRTVWDELVAEGMLADFGILTHQWGDEWNLVFYTVGSDAAGRDGTPFQCSRPRSVRRSCGRNVLLGPLPGPLRCRPDAHE